MSAAVLSRVRALLLLAVLAAPPAADAHRSELSGAVAPATESPLQALDVLIGRWSLTSIEYLADGMAPRAEGVRTCRWALNSMAIRCDDRFGPFGTVDGSTRAVTMPESLFYLSFNGQTGLFEYTYHSSALARPYTVPASYDEALRVLTGSAWVTDAQGEARLAKNESRLLGADRIEETVSVSLPGSQQRLELLEISLVRLDARTAPLLHF